MRAVSARRIRPALVCETSIYRRNAWIKFGESNDEPNSNYAGLLDEVYFFVAVLTADEVKELYLEADSHEFRDIFCKLVCNRFFWAPCKSLF